MDALSEILESVRIRGRMYCRVEARAPWGMSAEPSRIATFHGMIRGQGVLRVAGEKAVEVRTGDLVVLCHGSAHAIGDSASTPTLPITQVIGSSEMKVVTCGGTGARSTIVCGCFFTHRRDGPPLLSLLPPVLHLKTAGMAPMARALLDLLAEEAERSGGSDAAIARLTEALFVHVVRAWSETDGARSATWLAALRDARIGEALGCIHRRPKDDWSVADLARVAGMSRSAFAARFLALVGETPLHYVTRWRMYLATRQLRETTRSVAEIASQLGYDSEASLNKAFKRTMGIPPGAFRREARAT